MYSFLTQTYIYANSQIIAQHAGDTSANPPADRYFYLHDRLKYSSLKHEYNNLKKNSRKLSGQALDLCHQLLNLCNLPLGAAVAHFLRSFYRIRQFFLGVMFLHCCCNEAYKHRLRVERTGSQAGVRLSTAKVRM